MFKHHTSMKIVVPDLRLELMLTETVCGPKTPVL